MNRALQYILFYGIFFFVFFGMHLYVFCRLNRSFNVSRPVLFSAIVILALTFPVCTLLEKFFPSMITMLFYTLASIWLGVLFLLLSVLLVSEPVRLFFSLDSRAAGLCIVGVVLLLSGYGLINAVHPQVKTITVPIAGLKETLRLVQLSDIHVGTIHNSGYLTKVVNTTNALQPDMVLITGDLFDGIGPVSRRTVAPLGKLRAKTFFVSGNHEKYYGIDKVAAVMENTGAVFLRNQVVRYGGLQIAGVDYPERENQKANPVVGKLALDGALPSILMYHPPAGTNEAAEAGIDLQLSGHTHAGQLFPFTLLVKLFFPYTDGLHRLGNMHLYVSAGTGTWGPPMRLGSRSEITLIRLIPIPDRRVQHPFEDALKK